MLETIQEIARTFVAVAASIILILLAAALCAKACSDESETRITAETCQAASLPKIDREAALELLESGECIGGEIEEAKFTVWVCKQ